MPDNICPICGKGQMVERDDGLEMKYVDRKGFVRPMVLPNLRRFQCNSCGEDILDDAATREVEDARRSAAGLLSAAEVRELRSRFGKTQVQMSRLLGVGEKTYCRWESGSYVQSVAFDNYMRLIREVPEAFTMLTRLEQHGVSDIQQTGDIEEAEFAFLTNIHSLHEPAARFTQLMVTGTLHTSIEQHL